MCFYYEKVADKYQEMEEHQSTKRIVTLDQLPHYYYYSKLYKHTDNCLKQIAAKLC